MKIFAYMFNHYCLLWAKRNATLINKQSIKVFYKAYMGLVTSVCKLKL